MAKHFLLGGSTAERTIHCAGWAKLAEAMGQGEEVEDPIWTREGTAMHAVNDHCLKNQVDAWETVGETFEGIVITGEMADACQVYLDTVRPLEVPTAQVYREYFFHEPTVHPQFGGTVDHGTATDSLLTVTDFKGGAGVPVDVEENSQIMYYAYGLLLHHPSVRRVVLRIVQPRAFHPDGPVRRWETTADHIHSWVQDTLVPAMHRADAGGHLDAGKWCRFCPAKLVCPLLRATFEAAATYDAKAVPQMDDGALGREWLQIETVKMYSSAVFKEVERRLRAGRDLAGPKLVLAKADRIYKPGAEELFIKQFGNEAYAPPKLLSPAQMEKLNDAAKKLVHEYAYVPQTGYSVAGPDDRRDAVKIETVAEKFAGYLEGKE